ncbi:unnamed protein product [Bursaphelenchus okinawaensis]|uniref:Uncharacterized protein n=1 Tax=Bursaphelenchus okinawaensis TaxID=465554 RepID=A0A811LQ23_9BILA|nr:unnamed protein product [Bursaphelenchus okinawaensis]CAG9127744.1 unnamed protein product [Bursaphelenchus okinawaensis]
MERSKPSGNDSERSVDSFGRSTGDLARPSGSFLAEMKDNSTKSLATEVNIRCDDLTEVKLRSRPKLFGNSTTEINLPMSLIEATERFMKGLGKCEPLKEDDNSFLMPTTSTKLQIGHTKSLDQPCKGFLLSTDADKGMNQAEMVTEQSKRSRERYESFCEATEGSYEGTSTDKSFGFKSKDQSFEAEDTGLSSEAKPKDQSFEATPLERTLQVESVQSAVQNSKQRILPSITERSSWSSEDSNYCITSIFDTDTITSDVFTTATNDSGFISTSNVEETIGFSIANVEEINNISTANVAEIDDICIDKPNNNNAFKKEATIPMISLNEENENCNEGSVQNDTTFGSDIPFIDDIEAYVPHRATQVVKPIVLDSEGHKNATEGQKMMYGEAMSTGTSSGFSTKNCMELSTKASLEIGTKAGIELSTSSTTNPTSIASTNSSTKNNAEQHNYSTSTNKILPPTMTSKADLPKSQRQHLKEPKTSLRFRRDSTQSEVIPPHKRSLLSFSRFGYELSKLGGSKCSLLSFGSPKSTRKSIKNLSTASSDQAKMGKNQRMKYSRVFGSNQQLSSGFNSYYRPGFGNQQSKRSASTTGISDHGEYDGRFEAINQCLNGINRRYNGKNGLNRSSEYCSTNDYGSTYSIDHHGGSRSSKQQHYHQNHHHSHYQNHYQSPFQSSYQIDHSSQRQRRSSLTSGLLYSTKNLNGSTVTIASTNPRDSTKAFKRGLLYQNPSLNDSTVSLIHPPGLTRCNGYKSSNYGLNGMKMRGHGEDGSSCTLMGSGRHLEGSARHVANFNGHLGAKYQSEDRYGSKHLNESASHLSGSNRHLLGSKGYLASSTRNLNSSTDLSMANGFLKPSNHHFEAKTLDRSYKLGQGVLDQNLNFDDNTSKNRHDNQKTQPKLFQPQLAQPDPALTKLTQLDKAQKPSRKSLTRYQTDQFGSTLSLKAIKPLKPSKGRLAEIKEVHRSSSCDNMSKLMHKHKALRKKESLDEEAAKQMALMRMDKDEWY